MTQEQKYTVLESRDDIELRQYAPCVVADVIVTGSEEKASNAAFRPLFAYISGSNHASTSLAMTAPVLQQSGEKLAMTSPVIQEAIRTDSEDESTWTVSFVMPGTGSIAEYPLPNDPRVTLRAVPGDTAAVVRWSGRWTSGNVAKRTEQLHRAIAAAGWQIAGNPRWARFDPPWKPPFARRNEIVIPVRTSPRVD